MSEPQTLGEALDDLNAAFRELGRVIVDELRKARDWLRSWLP